MVFPRGDLPQDYFADGDRIAVRSKGELIRESLADLLTLSRLENRMGIYPVGDSHPGAFPTIEDAIGEAIEKVPVTVPRTNILLSLSGDQDHEVDLDLPKTHSFVFVGPSQSIVTQSNPKGGRLVGRLGVEKYQQSAYPNIEETRVILSNISLGKGQDASLILDAQTGWTWYAERCLIYGCDYRVTFDPLITDFFSQPTIYFNYCDVNSFQNFKFMNSAPISGGSIFFENMFLFGSPSSPPRFYFDGNFIVDFRNVRLIGFPRPTGTVFDAAPGSNGRMFFENIFWQWIPTGNPFTLFTSNMSGMRFYWNGWNVFTEDQGGFGVSTFDLGGNIGTHFLAPTVIGQIVPANPQVGTRRRDVGGTEKDLFWNGASWV